MSLSPCAVNKRGQLEESTSECGQCWHCTANREREPERNIEQSFSDGRRWIGDAQSWVLPLPLDGVQLPATSSGDEAARDLSSVTTWELEWRYDKNGRAGSVDAVSSFYSVATAGG